MSRLPGATYRSRPTCYGSPVGEDGKPPGIKLMDEIIEREEDDKDRLRDAMEDL